VQDRKLFDAELPHLALEQPIAAPVGDALADLLHPRMSAARFQPFAEGVVLLWVLAVGKVEHQTVLPVVQSHFVGAWRG
jgi:hypothetical protein